MRLDHVYLALRRARFDLRALLCLLAASACSDHANKPTAQDKDAAARADTEAGSEHEDASITERDASEAMRDGGERPTDAGTTDGGSPNDAARDSASDTAMPATDGAARDAAGDASITIPQHTHVYVGGYSDDDGLHVYEIDRATYALSPIAHDAGAGPQPSYITASADGRTLYVANEDDSNAGITVLRVNESTGVPSRIDHEDAITSSFVFSSIAPNGQYLLASSYNGGNVAVFPIKPDGTLDPRVDARDFGGGAQSHSVRVHASGNWAYVPNKALDSVAQLKFNATTGKLSDNTPATFAAQSGFDGPRHIAFSRDGKLAFVILELGNALFSLSVQNDGTLQEIDHEEREAASSSVAHTGAHVLAHPSANFVYGSNRVSNTLVAFAYDAQGQLTLVGRVPSRGKTPRNFDIDPLGKFLIVANQEASSGSGGSLAVFAIEANGSLTPKGSVVTGLESPAAVAIIAH